MAIRFGLVEQTKSPKAKELVENLLARGYKYVSIRLAEKLTEAKDEEKKDSDKKVDDKKEKSEKKDSDKKDATKKDVLKEFEGVKFVSPDNKNLAPIELFLGETGVKIVNTEKPEASITLEYSDEKAIKELLDGISLKDAPKEEKKKTDEVPAVENDAAPVAETPKSQSDVTPVASFETIKFESVQAVKTGATDDKDDKDDKKEVKLDKENPKEDITEKASEKKDAAAEPKEDKKPSSRFEAIKTAVELALSLYVENGKELAFLKELKEAYPKDADVLAWLDEKIKEKETDDESAQIAGRGREETDDKIIDATKPEDFKEDVNALISGETLTEDFKIKTAVIFAAAVNKRVKETQKSLEESFNTKVQTGIDEGVKSIVTTVDKYLNILAEEWKEENKIALDSGLRTKISEDFLIGMKKLFTESFIQIPESKVDMFGKLTEDVHKLEEVNKKNVKTLEEKEKTLKAMAKKLAITEASKGLSMTSAEKLAALAEGVVYTTETEFKKNLNLLIENYRIGKTQVVAAKKEELEGTPVVLTENNDVLPPENNTAMTSYLQQMKRMANEHIA